MGKGSGERGGRTDVRQRRALQRLGQDPFDVLGVEAGDGIVLDGALGTISIDLATDPGLAFSSGDLTVIVGNGLELTATGIEVDLAASSGLAFSTGDLIIDLRDTTPALELTANGVGVIVGAGLELTATGIEIDLAANPGLAFSSGDLIVTVGAGLELTATGVEIDLATDPGLEFSSGDIRVKIKTAGGITRDSDGLSQTQVSDSGVYTPTITNVTNVTSSTARLAFWTRQGDIVTVVTRVDIKATVSNVTTDVIISLPIAPETSFAGVLRAAGVGSYFQSPDNGVSGVVFAEDADPDAVRFRYRPTVSGGSEKGFHIVFRYSLN